MTDKKKRVRRKTNAPAIGGAWKNANIAARKKAIAELPNGAVRLIDKEELLARVPLSYPNIWERMKKGTFPRSRMIGDRTFWLESEIEEYIASLPVRPLKGDAAETVEA